MNVFVWLNTKIAFKMIKLCFQNYNRLFVTKESNVVHSESPPIRFLLKQIIRKKNLTVIPLVFQLVPTYKRMTVGLLEIPLPLLSFSLSDLFCQDHNHSFTNLDL